MDQELSLFHDVPPKLSITDLDAALPDSDTLWCARSAGDWFQSLEQVYAPYDKDRNRNPLSLHSLFRLFMKRGPDIFQLHLNPIQLRLLLHPLQALVCHLHECFVYIFNDGKDGNGRQFQRLMGQLEEVQPLLQQWYSLYTQCTLKDEVLNPASCISLVLYHLISLNTITHFRQIERFARGELHQDEFKQSFWVKIRFVEEANQLWFHCGQIIRLLRLIPELNRPPWWAGAVYRVALIMWTTSIANTKSQEPFPPPGSSLDEAFVIDVAMPEDMSTLRYLRYREGVPMLSTRKGELVSPGAPRNTLSYCLGFLDEEEATVPLTNGIKDALTYLLNRYHN